METCPHCGKAFEVKVHPDLIGLGHLTFVCPSCGVGFTSEQLPKIVWKRDGQFGHWYTCLVPRHTKIDGVNIMSFEHK